VRVVSWDQVARESAVRLIAPPVVPSADEPERLLRGKEVEKLVGVSRQTLWRMERDGDFPKRVRIGKNGVRWKASEVNAWLTVRSPKAGT
jgi:prophage regulatory protein